MESGCEPLILMIPEYEDLQLQVWPAVSVEWSAHAEHSVCRLPSKRVQLQWHDNWLQSVKYNN